MRTRGAALARSRTARQIDLSGRIVVFESLEKRSPDFFVRTADTIYLAETKAQGQLAHPNVKRKRRAAVAWCERINALEPPCCMDKPGIE